MPELPEVETMRRTLSELILEKKIVDVEVRLPRLIRQPDPDEFARQLAGGQITDIRRRGKYLILEVPPHSLVMHMRMEGQLSLHSTGEPERPHTHIRFVFSDGSELRYRDVRQFGTMDLVPAGQWERVGGLKDLGLEPVGESFTLAAFRKVLERHPRRKLKALLLDQRALAGLGNIYTDEALYLARLHPETMVQELKPAQIRRLHQAIQEVLQRGIEAGGASVRTYLNGKGEMGYFQLQIQVYGRKGQPCPRCGRMIERIVVAGRGTHLCPRCQRRRPVQKDAHRDANR